MKIAAGVCAVIAATALVGLSGCGSPGGGPGSTPATSSSSAASSIAAVSTTGSTAGTPAAAVITITNFAYQGPDSVTPGSTVTVKNEDSQAHTVTSDQAGLFDAVVPGGGKVVFTVPTTAGSYAYHCTYHSNMHGTLVVK
jgi:plastocyanin